MRGSQPLPMPRICPSKEELMKKIKSLFVREYDENGKFQSTPQITEGCEWVVNGEGVATRKYDGTCCLVMNGELYKRFDFKPGRTLPHGAIPCQDEPDEITGHFPHWVKCDESEPQDKWHIKAFINAGEMEDGTYELCGVHFANNIDKLAIDGDVFVRHGADVLGVQDRTFAGIKEYLRNHFIEGIVFHRGNGEMCKVKRSDFGISWGKNR